MGDQPEAQASPDTAGYRGGVAAGGVSPGPVQAVARSTEVQVGGHLFRAARLAEERRRICRGCCVAPVLVVAQRPTDGMAIRAQYTGDHSPGRSSPNSPGRRCPGQSASHRLDRHGSGFQDYPHPDLSKSYEAAFRLGKQRRLHGGGGGAGQSESSSLRFIAAGGGDRGSINRMR